MSNIDIEEITNMHVDRLLKDTDDGELVPAGWIFAGTTPDDHFIGEIREIRRSGDGEIEITVSLDDH